MEHKELLEIAQIVSHGDEAVLSELTRCLTDQDVYFSAHQERYEERGIESDAEPEQIRWLGLVDILEENNYVCERDWKDEKEDFVYFFSNLSGVKRLKLEVDPDWLDESGDIEAWCRILDEKWAGQQCCAAAINIDSDSYVLFACTLEDLARLEPLAQVTDYSIEKV